MSGSGMIDEDTARTVQSGRETLGVLLGTVQKKLQKAFIFFAVGLLGGVVAMRAWVWPTLKADLLARGADVIAQTPFDVILLQVKIGLVTGILLTVPPLLYYAREPMAERGVLPDVRVARWKVALLGVVSALLFVGGILYGYYVFFPVMFDFLATNALGAGFAPLYSIVHWTQFIMVLGFSFGVAAQLPLAMTALSYYGIVPYETFRDRWKYAVIAIFTFGALFSPPDPFTQIMWAFPLLMLYAFSLYLAKVVVTAKRGRDRVDIPAELRARWNRVAGAAVLAGGAAVAFFRAGGVGAVNRSVLPALPAAVRPAPLPPVEAAVGLPRGTAVAAIAVAAGLAVAVLVLLYYVYAVIREQAAIQAAERAGAPADLDLDGLDEAGVRAAPPEAFAGMAEEDALAAAQRAMDGDDPEKARAILDRFDEAEDVAAGAEDVAAGAEDAAAGAEDAAEDEPRDSLEAAADREDEAESGNVVGRTTAGVMNAFTDEETTEDDIGGYYYDLAFIFDSLRSGAFRIAAVFMLVLAGVFGWLYSGGIGAIRSDFISRIPPEIRPTPAETNWPITLHPVEALVFEVKISTVIAAVVALPLVVYYAWPAMSERGLVTGDRRVISTWGGVLLVGLAGGSAIGYAYVAPSIISWLVADTLAAEMIVSYRVNNFFWLVFLTTVGIGLLADVPATMVLFQQGGIVSYRSMRRRWRLVVIGTFAFGALVTPDSLYTMFLIAVPVCVAYGVGLGLLWLVTLGGRRERPGPGVAEPDGEESAI